MKKANSAKQLDKLEMPHTIEAEKSLLACILLDEKIQIELLEKLEEEDFYLENNRILLNCMKTVVYARVELDFVTLVDALEKQGNLKKVGDIACITELVNSIPSAANYKSYYNIVKRDSTHRKLMRGGQSIIERARESLDTIDSIAYAEKVIFDISKMSDTSDLIDMREDSAFDDVLQKFELIAKDKDALRGVPTGFNRLDQITNGLQKSDLVVLAARPGVGKTTIGMNIIENACLIHDKVCAVFSLEMPRIQLAQRLICSYAKVSMSKAMSGKLDQNDWAKLWQASTKIKKAKLFIDDSSIITPAEILSKCRRLKTRKEGLDLVMIDYLQLMRSGERRAEENRQQEIASITRNLKIMAKELNLPILCLSQLRRISAKEEPQLSDLRESGAIEQDADMVLFIHRPEVAATAEEIKAGVIKKGEADLIIAKHRNGELGRVKLQFKADEVRYINPPVDLHEDGQYAVDGGNFIPPTKLHSIDAVLEDIPFETAVRNDTITTDLAEEESLINTDKKSYPLEDMIFGNDEEEDEEFNYYGEDDDV